MWSKYEQESVACSFILHLPLSTNTYIKFKAKAFASAFAVKCTYFTYREICFGLNKRKTKSYDATLTGGPVHKSVFVEDCKNCVFFLCCKYFRSKESKMLDIYLRVKSRAIIVDSEKIRFAPYTWNHDRSAEWHRLAEFDVTMER
jgi:hypothetical protein